MNRAWPGLSLVTVLIAADLPAAFAARDIFRFHFVPNLCCVSAVPGAARLSRHSGLAIAVLDPVGHPLTGKFFEAAPGACRRGQVVLLLPMETSTIETGRVASAFIPAVFLKGKGATPSFRESK